MSEFRIDEGMEVTLHFTLKLEDGTVVDSTRDKQPATFQVGDGNLPPGFERPLKGLVGGESGSFEIAPEHGFGQRNPQNVQMLSRDDFEEIEPEVGTVMSFADPAGGELPGVIIAADERNVEVDFNHPLAGRTLTFEVEVLDVRPAQTH
ncbi:MULTISPECIES: FKBP-type peptidyl-prolyl cis-trans isomerase [Halomonadaceae]|uniref:Peptidyl-prolyl cis-trans isomerase n=3 Tax=Billgrantia TaxID=3137761 RepID=A0AAW4Z266_9GAMM|nr:MULTISPECIES: FKBP-type peptidyl-prolyl cis-trans isomerase [Halomonas]MCE8003004.1 FKBP-type peptidyl-prolyl cis-trans isomerase [Halomonas ethanolica]MCE8010123.1 FKBP-type peptidyl-prolyl cis-trans isomerase [Halomonas desiderata]MCE8027000.1 FKBP-type peptidyl-prolyl cis-trans isomerase [Halomonas aerodenitrificans]MCE8030872.1 FKBP-type peptidyl-prolyl cis-trans isomerase [Halomonas desiderata]MCE8039022.1 FKBP-type peptidyl-prolyl cis-trans isomerase [Halomonas sp. MCCC 1A11062]